MQYRKYFINNNLSGLALDIDETISKTNEYLFKEIFDVFGNPENLSINEAIQKYKYTHNIPHVKDTQEFEEWHRINIDNPDSYVNIKPIEEAVLKIHSIHNNIIPIVAYITARSECVMKVTEEWIEKNNFPIAKVICKPDSIPLTRGNEWKASVLEELHPYVTGIVDDNPNLSPNLSSNYPGKVFLYNNKGLETESSKHIIKCDTWEDVYNEISKLY